MNHSEPVIMTLNKENLRIVFMGTPEFAVGTLQRLIEEKYNVVAVVTQPDKPVGRHGSVLQQSDVKQYAMAHDIPVLQPEKMKDETFVEELRGYQADLQVVVAFRMLPEIVWSMPRLGTFNVHAALLPQYRGAAPINWAVINGEKQTGVTTFFLDKDIDTGRIIMQKPFPIGEEDNVEVVYDGLMKLGADVCIETIDKIIAGNGQVESLSQEQMIDTGKQLKQAPKIFKETCVIDWDQPAQQIHDFIRGLSPYPGAWTQLADGEGGKQVLKIFDSRVVDDQDQDSGNIKIEKGNMIIAAGKGALCIQELQLAGKKRMSARDFVNGMHNLENFHVE